MFELPALPYAKNALEPFITEQTFNFHYEKHHQTYVTNLNNLIKGTDFEHMTLDEIISQSSSETQHLGIFNNAAQVWNHTFYWNSMMPKGGKEPSGQLLDMIKRDFGSMEEFAKEFKQAAVTQFGSGWAWLVLAADKKLKVVKTGNADCPQLRGMIPLLTCDVWEHAYYIDYQNRRPDYVETFLKSLVNWSFAEKNLKEALA